ncbi:type II secretion system protein J [Synechococcus sp. RSCCF101]|uniref:PulJ/GspJ family protein n=1 Tax=Synechococcus sp. RSCCF101 TaxID=2511069 RepID=UPI0017849DF6|nr:prepilin-type N-terminal cleavage/methylation domain-containing protein [Synechococcus sp. RSCCF101]
MQRARQGAFTLAELLVSLGLTGLVAIAAFSLLRGELRLSEATIWDVHFQRDLNRLNSLMELEASEACMFGTTSNPASCAPTGAATCATTVANQLRMLVPMLDTSNDPPTDELQTIRFHLDTNNDRLLRDGPAILPSGALDIDTRNNLNNLLVMSNVTGFAVTNDADCRTVNVDVTMSPIGSTATRTQSMVLRTGVSQFVD